MLREDWYVHYIGRNKDPKQVEKFVSMTGFLGGFAVMFLILSFLNWVGWNLFSSWFVLLAFIIIPILTGGYAGFWIGEHRPR